MAARVTSSGPAQAAPISAASLAAVVEHVSRCADVSEYTRSRLRLAAVELGAVDALRAEVERLRRQGAHSSRLPKTVSPAAS